MSYIVHFNGKSSEELGLLVVRRPNYEVAEETINEYEIPGRETNLIERSGNYGRVAISVEFNYVTDRDGWGEAFRQAILWLRESGQLQFSDDMDVFRKVLYVQILTNMRDVKRLGKFTAMFMCEPGEYYVSGQEFQSVSGTLNNPYSEARPIYRINNNGDITLTVNGNVMTVASQSGTIIDTSLKIAYTADGTITNTAVSGDYDGLVLVPGDNTISVSRGTVDVQPNWRVL